MNRKLLFCLSFAFFFLFSGNNPLFAQLAYWAQKAGGVTPDEGADISVDAAGNTYTTGYFTGSATFGSLSLNASGLTDIFLTKTDNQGLFLWAVKAGGSGADRGHSIKTDAQGNSYVTGYYYGTATFGSQSITSAGVNDVFIAKYDNAGTLVWVKSAGGSNADIGNGIAIDNSGNVFITGEFSGTAAFGSFSLSSMNNTVDVFTAKLDPSGNFLWAKKGSAPSVDRGIDLDCDELGNVYVTGQFTDTITFDVTHNSNMYNAVFVVKYNGNGDEQWFRRAGGSSLSIVSGIAVDLGNNIYITGDFTGNIIFFGTSNTTLSNTYANRIYLAKYNSSGDLLWTHADGSSSEFSAKNLTIDVSGNAYVVGNFKCRLSGYADFYGQGTFNSVGYWDIFVSKYSATGAWQFSRSCGGKRDDYGAGIAVNSSGQIHTTGSFIQQLVFPVPDDFLGYGTQPVASGNEYCDDPDYSIYRALNSGGNSDIFISKIFDPNRAPYDYYRRSDAGCNRDYKGVCINANQLPCPDTAFFCTQGTLSASSYTTPAGPAFAYNWDPGGANSALSVSASGVYYVTQTSQDGCFTSTDSIYVQIVTAPAIPTITDNQGINTNAVVTDEIIVCSPDSVLLTAGGYNSYDYHWSTPTPGETFNTVSIWASEPGQYVFHILDTITSCFRTNSVVLTVEDPFLPVVPLIYPLDTGAVSLCSGEMLDMYVYDTIANPLGIGNLCIEFADVIWTATGPNFYMEDTLLCIFSFAPEETGDYLVTAMVLRANHCDTDTISTSYTIHVEVNPVPDEDSLLNAIASIDIILVGDSNLCPGDSTLLIASSSPNYLWGGPGVPAGTTNDSIWIFAAGTYTVSTSVSDTNSYGCGSSATAQATQLITLSTQPTITMNPVSGLICPDDSVYLQCSGTGIFEWYGPGGPVGGNFAGIYVGTSGTYYCVRTDLSGCQLISNSVEVDQYATPFLVAVPDAVLCENDSAVITVFSNPESVIQWQSPLSGSSLTQTVSEGGVYTCMVTSCGIQTVTSIEITVADLTAEITVSGPLAFCEGDSVTLTSNAATGNYYWERQGSPGIIATDTLITVFESGTYILTVFNSTGCTETDLEAVDVEPDTLSAPFVTDTTICAGEYIILVASGTGSIAWYDAPSGSAAIASGAEYTTPVLIDDVIYYIGQSGQFCSSDKAPVTVTVDFCENGASPDVFTPNQDGINDLFSFPLFGTTCFNCKIYNRWGRLMYEWGDATSGWDGTNMHTGNEVNEGVYYYVLDWCDYKDTNKKEAGFIQLLR